MIAAPRLLLSDRPPELPQKAGLGDRFHYFRGRSGRRYIFTAVEAGDLADFADAVIVTATPAGNGRLSIHAVSVVGAASEDQAGRIARRAGDRLVLVHLLAATQAERLALADDLAGVPLAMAA